MSTIRELKLWEAYETFGSQAVDEILHDPQWRDRYPDVFERLDSEEMRTHFDTAIPLPMLRAMASVKAQEHVFFIRGNVLHSYPAGTKLPNGFTVISASEALEKFGTEAIHNAADKGTSEYPTSITRYIPADDSYRKKPKD